MLSSSPPDLTPIFRHQVCILTVVGLLTVVLTLLLPTAWLFIVVPLAGLFIPVFDRVSSSPSSPVKEPSWETAMSPDGGVAVSLRRLYSSSREPHPTRTIPVERPLRDYAAVTDGGVASGLGRLYRKTVKRRRA